MPFVAAFLAVVLILLLSLLLQGYGGNNDGDPTEEQRGAGGNGGEKELPLPDTERLLSGREPPLLWQLPPQRVRQITNSIGLKLVRIPSGPFLMGSPTSEEDHGDQEHQHPVVINRPFYLGVYEVTQAQYLKIMLANPSQYREDKEGKKGGPNYPVESVTWHEARTFCALLSTRPEEKAAGRVYRLPTEEEWEYACRAGTTTPFSYGASLSSFQANFNGNVPYGGAQKGPNTGQTVPVGSYLPNAWGLFDMHGNVYEWCADKHPQTEQYALRGGSYLSTGTLCRSARRFWFAPDQRHSTCGFRVACDVQVKAP
jgi:formylglycine-generating enzyme required for sulfatase activity